MNASRAQSQTDIVFPGNFLSRRESLLACRFRRTRRVSRMNEQLIEEVVEEIRPALAGRHWGKLFQLSGASLAVDFRAGGGRYLLLSAEPNQPRLHLITRTVRELEKASHSPSPFALVLRKHLGGATLKSLSKDEGERVVRFQFAAPDATGAEHAPSLVAQLTGRTSNLFLLDGRGRIVDSLRPSRGAGQEVGDVYAPPAAGGAPTRRDAAAATRDTPVTTTAKRDAPATTASRDA